MVNKQMHPHLEIEIPDWRSLQLSPNSWHCGHRRPHPIYHTSPLPSWRDRIPYSHLEYFHKQMLASRCLNSKKMQTIPPLGLSRRLDLKPILELLKWWDIHVHLTISQVLGWARVIVYHKPLVYGRQLVLNSNKTDGREYILTTTTNY